MFKPPKMEDEDFSPFGGKSGLFSGGRGLFDDDDEVHETKSFSVLPPSNFILDELWAAARINLCCIVLFSSG